jgi:hypothetical protein
MKLKDIMGIKYCACGNEVHDDLEVCEDCK